MSHDLLSKKLGRRNWARGNPPRPTDPIIAGPLPAPIKKIAKGAMILGTLAGLAFITSPWWKPLPKNDPMRKRMFLRTGTTANRVTWSRR
jgi:hypothetical protein